MAVATQQRETFRSRREPLGNNHGIDSTIEKRAVHIHKAILVTMQKPGIHWTLRNQTSPCCNKDTATHKQIGNAGVADNKGPQCCFPAPLQNAIGELPVWNNLHCCLVRPHGAYFFHRKDKWRQLRHQCNPCVHRNCNKGCGLWPQCHCNLHTRMDHNRHSQRRHQREHTPGEHAELPIEHCVEVALVARTVGTPKVDTET